MLYDIIIIGAGPAGLFLGSILSDNNIDFLILDQGKAYSERDEKIPFDVSYGVGGAGLYSDGKISYSPSASKMWSKLNKNELKTAYNYVKELLENNSVHLKEWDDSWTDIKKFDKEKHYQSDYIDNNERERIIEYLCEKVKKRIKLNTKVLKISNSYRNNFYEIVTNSKPKTYFCKKVVIATGKSDVNNLFSKINIDTFFQAEMGVRLEVPFDNSPIREKSQVDYKYINVIDENTEIRTFCYCKDGIVRESMIENHITYNGEKLQGKTGNTNIGILLKTYDEKSVYAQEMKVVMNDSNFTSGDILIGTYTDKQLKKRIMELGFNSSNYKIYGPEIERTGLYPILDDELESSKKGIYFIGDSTGIFRGLMPAFISGVYVGNIVLQKRIKNIRNIMQTLNIKQSDTQDMQLVFTAQSKQYFYCRDAICEFVLNKEKLPINPFRVFDYFLSDRVDRDIVRRGNNQLIKKCDELWVFGPIADGVLFEIAYAIELGKKIRFFNISTKAKEIRELSIDKIRFEPEVHARQVRKQDLIEFIKQSENALDVKINQISLYDEY